jgi:hypothetical protein
MRNGWGSRIQIEHISPVSSGLRGVIEGLVKKGAEEEAAFGLGKHPLHVALRAGSPWSSDGSETVPAGAGRMGPLAGRLTPVGNLRRPERPAIEVSLRFGRLHIGFFQFEESFLRKLDYLGIL